MKASLEYRSYVVTHDGSAYTAVSADGEPFQLRSKNLLRVTRAIDTLWNALEGKVKMPGWLSLPVNIIDIDAATSETMLVVDRQPCPTVRKLVPAVAPVQAVA
jgi:hypothetical protein